MRNTSRVIHDRQTVGVSLRETKRHLARRDDYYDRPRLANRRFLRWILAACFCTAVPQVATAGGGPENLFLVVNSDSPDSLTVANHFIQLRHVPACNVLELPWNPSPAVHDVTDVDVFREKILRPVLGAIENRKLIGQIDYIIYSCDFPWKVRLAADIAKGEAKLRGLVPSGSPPTAARWPKHLTDGGSINSMTYLWQPVLAGFAGYMQLDANRYTRLGYDEQKDQPTLAFRSAYQFGPRGELVATGGRRYMLSTMLGVTPGPAGTVNRANTVSEVLGYLRRSAAADGTHPEGTIYFCRVENEVRSRTREKIFDRTVKELKELGVAAEVVQGRLPARKNDVQGLMTGTSIFNFKASGSTIRPGAICEHLTSWGGAMRSPSGQTPLSEFLRHGAAGASGTVQEPYALQSKFPLASIHVHYARGCTLAEAFYQSVYGPYQLLIVGDPLCRPWANIPEVSVEGVPPGAAVKGPITLTPKATFPRGGQPQRFELFIDGWRRAVCTPGKSIELDTAGLADGYHEFRMVAVESGPIASQGRKIFGLSTANHGRTITVDAPPPGRVDLDKPLIITANSPGSIGITVMHNSRVVGRITGEKGDAAVYPKTLGSGPVQLQVVGLGRGGRLSYVTAKPIELTVGR